MKRVYLKTIKSILEQLQVTSMQDYITLFDDKTHHNSLFGAFLSQKTSPRKSSHRCPIRSSIIGYIYVTNVRKMSYWCSMLGTRRQQSRYQECIRFRLVLVTTPNKACLVPKSTAEFGTKSISSVSHKVCTNVQPAK